MAHARYLHAMETMPMKTILRTGLPALALVAILFAAAPAHAADYAPLNCAAAKSPTERTICGNYALGQLEARMATLYEWAPSFVAMGQRGDLQDAQRAFLKTREACGANVGCIRNAYEGRIAQLQAVMAGIRAKGPF
jgi:uncharacterized protein